MAFIEWNGYPSSEPMGPLVWIGSVPLVLESFWEGRGEWVPAPPPGRIRAPSLRKGAHEDRPAGSSGAVAREAGPGAGGQRCGGGGGTVGREVGGGADVAAAAALPPPPHRVVSGVQLGGGRGMGEGYPSGLTHSHDYGCFIRCGGDPSRTSILRIGNAPPPTAPWWGGNTSAAVTGGTRGPRGAVGRGPRRSGTTREEMKRRCMQTNPLSAG